MKYAKWMMLLVLALVIFSAEMFATAPVTPKKELAPAALYPAAQAAQKKGNWRDAYELYRKALETEGAIEAKQGGTVLQQGTYCLQRLNQYSKIDEFVEAMLKTPAHKDNYYLVYQAAQYYRHTQHYGYIVSGEYHRGSHRGGGRWVYSTDRDRMRALQLMERAVKLLVQCDVPVGSHGYFYRDFASYYRKQPWQMTALSDTSKLPDYGNGYHGGGRGYPVNAKGDPIYFFVPKSYKAAVNDGERWRWLLAESSRVGGGRSDELRRVAQFAHGSLGVQTLQQYSSFFGRSNEADDKANQKGVWAIHTLGETETIARTAAGIRRLTLPKEYQFVRHYRETKNLHSLASCYENRRQYTEAAEVRNTICKGRNYPAIIKSLESQLKTLQAQVEKGVPAKQKKNYADRIASAKKRLEIYRRVQKKYAAKLYVPMADEEHYWQQLCQLRGNMGQFEPVMTQPAGKGATLQYRYRNATKATFTAEAIDIEKLLADCKAYIKTKPAKYNWQTWRNQTELNNIGQRLISQYKTVPGEENIRVEQKLQMSRIGYQLVKADEAKYITAKTAEWSLDLKPRANHWDKRITVTTPLQKAGAYLVTAKLADGNISKIIVWVADTVMVKKQIDKGRTLYYVADSVTGTPVAKANIEFFAYRRYYSNSSYRWEIKNFSEHTDDDGMAYLDKSKIPGSHSWSVLAMARTKAGRLAYLGFQGVWFNNASSAGQPSVTKLFYLTDRPVYRPEQTVKWKFWYNNANYGKKDYDSPYANRKVYVRINTPRGEKAWDGYVTLDKFGGANGELALKAGCQLGAYQWQARWSPTSSHLGSGSFRVEEYKKPEYEVTVEAPKDPVALGETITAKVTAKYYFGGAVTDAKVKYKVLRTEHSAAWFPSDHWDWLYGNGYWWFGCDYNWYPGWRNWGCKRPYYPWWGYRSTPKPELVAEGEAKIGKDGTLEIPIDTSLAKAMHPDRDHKYEITAEVRDASRRTIVGTGQVLVSRKPFKVHAWVDRGYYRVGDTIDVNYFARRLDGKAVSGKGSLKLYKIGYKTGKRGEPVPTETLEGTWDNDVDDTGRQRQALIASEPGQYRVSCTVTDKAGHAIEGAYVFTIWGEGTTGEKFRFNGLELLPDRKNYKSGDTVDLRVNTARRNSTVLLFVRCANGLCPTPKVLRLKGRSIAEAIKLSDVDMPNIFIEAVSIGDGKVHNEIRQIVVPPKKRIAKIQMVPDKTEYLPGKTAKIKLLVTDHTGEPFSGQVALTMYDKSVEYISGGSNIGDIRKTFWGWKRGHSRQLVHSLSRGGYNLILPGHTGMRFVGCFGHSVANTPWHGEAGNGLAYPEGEDMEMSESGPGTSVDRLRGDRKSKEAMSPSEPMPSAEMAVGGKMSPKKSRGDYGWKKDNAPADKSGAAGGGDAPAVAVRSNFADTAKWIAALATAKNGVAEIEIEMPENLTTWKTRTWVMGTGCEVGAADVEVLTTKPVICRLQAPRFFIQKDECVLSAVVVNRARKELTFKVHLGLGKSPMEIINGKATQDLTIAAGESKRVDWRVKVTDEGEAKLTMTATGPDADHSDAMVKTFPCKVHGMLKTESYSGVIRQDGKTGTINIRVPKERRPAQSRLEVRYSPTLAGAMLDALPYLIQYPYGCTEQTLNRFLPAVITRKSLQDLGVDLAAIEKHRTNLNAMEIGDDKKRLAAQALTTARWRNRLDRLNSPVFNKATLDAVVKAGVDRLTSQQCSDGGWGWFGGGHSYAHTTATVVHGLIIARQCDVAIVPRTIDRGVAWLKKYQAEEVRKLNNGLIKIADGTHPRPWKTQASNLDALVAKVLLEASTKNDNKAMRDFLYRDRLKMSVYGQCLIGQVFDLAKDARIAMIVKNIDQFLKVDDENQSAYLELPQGCYWWYWYGSEIEANAAYLKLLSKYDPKGKKAPGLVKYLLNNRRHATYWNSTRDTAYCVEAFADYLKASGEAKPDMTVEVLIDGKVHKTVKINSENLFTYDNKLVLTGKAVTDGKHTVTLRRKGKGPLYYNAYLTNFTLEDPIEKAGLEVKVTRKYYKLIRDTSATQLVETGTGVAAAQKVEKYIRVQIPDAFLKGMKVPGVESGDLIEVELTVESKNDYEYILIRDYKPAGCETVALRSGYSSNNGMWAYREFRDDHVCYFVRALARGKHSMSYRTRAEIPGIFSALPAKIEAMYAPELVGNSNEQKVIIVDEKPATKK